MPPRSQATATISFGLVSIPVKLFTSTESADSISFRLLHEKCKSPLKRPYYCPKDEEMVGREDIVRGFEYSKDQYVLFSEEEVKAVEEAVTKAIDIEEFVPLSEVDPVYFDKAYYLSPDKGGQRSYVLLAKALTEKGLAGIAKYAVRGKQYLVMVRPVGDRLVMQQLRYAHEVRSIDEVPVEEAKVKPAELKLAHQLIEQTASKEFKPQNYSDEVKGRLQEAIQQKVDGEEITIAPGEEPKAQVIDLMEALKASLAGKTAKADGGRKPAKSTTTTRAKKRAAR